MSKVLLINPHWYMAQGNFDDLWLPIPNGLASVAGALRQAGYQVAIVDSLAEGYMQREWQEKAGRRVCRVGLSQEALIKKIKEYDPSIIGIGNMFTSVFSGSVECAKIVREILPDSKIVMGGVHPSCSSEEVASITEIDYVICGEGEAAFPALVRYIEQSGEEKMPPGVCWSKNGKIMSSGAPEIIADLDVLPGVAYDLLNMELYRNAAKTDLINRGARGALTVPILTSRGCPYACIFCAAHKINGKRWRGRSPGRVVDEMERLCRDYGVNSFTIEDSNFSSDEQRAILICEEIIKRRLKIQWNMPNGLRADRVTARLVNVMKRAGCSEITLAAEHGDQEFLRRVLKKGLDLNDVLRATEMILKEGLPVSCFLMMGFPGEKEKELAKTVAFGRRLALAGALPIFFICSPLPGTEMYNTFMMSGCLPNKILDYEEYLCSFRAPIMNLPGNIDFGSWRRRAMQQAYFILLFRHPILFFRLPAMRKLMVALVSPQKFFAVLKKAYNQFAAKVENKNSTKGMA